MQNLFFFVSDQDEPAQPAHFTVLEVTPRDQGSELSSATMILQMTVVADLTRSEDELRTEAPRFEGALSDAWLAVLRAGNEGSAARWTERGMGHIGAW